VANSSAKIAAVSEPKLAIKNEHDDQGADHEVKWTLKTVSLTTSTETASTEVDNTDIGTMEDGDHYNNSKTDYDRALSE
jgi:hypothetical protein